MRGELVFSLGKALTTKKNPEQKNRKVGHKTVTNAPCTYTVRTPRIRIETTKEEPVVPFGKTIITKKNRKVGRGRKEPNSFSITSK